MVLNAHRSRTGSAEEARRLQTRVPDKVGGPGNSLDHLTCLSLSRIDTGLNRRTFGVCTCPSCFLGL